ncbi:hypothetical protein [Kitasatospora sp. NPDC093679]|uniref:hypothetical protein n=1 Tax=Kitasatospora sp. NPDC093679 TaxID=3154983 RepID=UPI00342BC548
MRRPLPGLVPPLLLLISAVAAWAVWLGWDQHHDVHPDGSVSGPYEAWQVIGLAVTLLVPVGWAAARHRVAGAVVGTTAGLTAAAFVDWSDDASGLFLVGVGTVMVGSLVATSVVAALVASLTRSGRPYGGRRRGPAPFG